MNGAKAQMFCEFNDYLADAAVLIISLLCLPGWSAVHLSVIVLSSFPLSPRVETNLGDSQQWLASMNCLEALTRKLCI